MKTLLLALAVTLALLVVLLLPHFKAALPAIKTATVNALFPVFTLLTRHMQRSGLMLGLFYFPEGSKIYFSSTFAAPLTVSAATNANPAQATSTGHALVDLDEVLYTANGWEDATNSVFRIDQQTANAFDFLGLDSSNTTFYPPGGGVGTVRKISNWLEMPQVLNVGSSGGDARLTNIELLAARNSIAVPTGFNPIQQTITMAHDPALANYKAMVALSRVLAPVAFKWAIGGGAVSYSYGYMSVSEVPILNRNQVNQVTAQISVIGRNISY